MQAPKVIVSIAGKDRDVEFTLDVLEQIEALSGRSLTQFCSELVDVRDAEKGTGTLRITHAISLVAACLGVTREYVHSIFAPAEIPQLAGSLSKGLFEAHSQFYPDPPKAQ